MKRTGTILAILFLTIGLFAQNIVVFDIRVDSVVENEAYFVPIIYAPDTSKQQQTTISTLPNNIRAYTEQIKSWKQTRMDYIVQIKDTTYSETFREGLKTKRDQLTTEIEKYKFEREYRKAVRDAIKLYIEKIE